MKRVASVMKRGISCFIAALRFSYSLVAISKSCSNCGKGSRTMATVENDKKEPPCTGFSRR